MQRDDEIWSVNRIKQDKYFSWKIMHEMREEKYLEKALLKVESSGQHLGFNILIAINLDVQQKQTINLKRVWE